MLSISTIKSAGAAVEYYRNIINYYAQDVENIEDKSQWYGAGAKELGLEGNVKDKDFELLLKGHVSDQRLGRNEGGEIKHRPGYDLTFSAPKSVSIMSEVVGDKRLSKAHTQAVKNTLDVLEKNVIHTRKTVEGATYMEKTGNLVVAMFEENTSRELDPQKHTHCVLMNMSKYGEKWMSIESKPIFEVQKFYGQIYRSFLAKEVGKLGYEVEITGKDSIFEIKGVPKDLINEFSKRRTQILEALGNYQYVNSKINEQVTLGTRKSKKSVDSEELKEIWSSLSNSLGFQTETAVQRLSTEYSDENITVEKNSAEKSTIERLSDKYEEFCRKFEYKIKKTIEHFSNHPDSPASRYDRSAKRAIEYGIEHLSERSSVWSEKELYIAAMCFSTKKLSYDDIEKEIESMKKEGELLTGKHEGMLTTNEAIKKEKYIIKTMKQGKGTSDQICKKTYVADRLRNTLLNSSQRKAVEHILCSKDKIVGVNGYAGTGKTFMMEKTKEIANGKGYEIIGLSPTASAANNLEKETGIKSQTIHKFLYQYKKLIENKHTGIDSHKYRLELRNKMLVVDEASLSSTNQIEAICKIANETFVKVVLIGDRKQSKSAEAGNPYSELQKRGMNTVEMNEIIRQKNNTLKSAVYDSINGLIESAFKKIDKNIYEIPSKIKDKKEGIIKATASHWINLNEEKRENTLIVSPSNKIREGINHEIRNYLKLENKLQGHEHKLKVLENKSLTKAEKCLATNYEKNDVILFNNEYKKLGIKKDEYLTVKEVKNNNIITLKNKQGREVNLNLTYTVKNLDKAIEVFKQKEINLQIGDTIKWTKNSKTNPLIINSEKGKILEIDNKNIIIKTGTDKNVVGAIESKHPYLTNQPMFYVTISRAKNEATIITDNKNILAKNIKNNTGYSISALEHIGTKNKPEVNNQALKQNSNSIKFEPQKIKFRI